MEARVVSAETHLSGVFIVVNMPATTREKSLAAADVGWVRETVLTTAGRKGEHYGMDRDGEVAGEEEEGKRTKETEQEKKKRERREVEATVMYLQA